METEISISCSPSTGCHALGSVAYVSLLLVNSVAILSEKRFLAPLNLTGNAQSTTQSYGTGFESYGNVSNVGEEGPGIKQRAVALVGAVRTLMRSEPSLPHITPLLTTIQSHSFPSTSSSSFTRFCSVNRYFSHFSTFAVASFNLSNHQEFDNNLRISLDVYKVTLHGILQRMHSHKSNSRQRKPSPSLHTIMQQRPHHAASTIACGTFQAQACRPWVNRSLRK